MALDLGNIPAYAVPDASQQSQIREAIGINDNIGTSAQTALARREFSGGVRLEKDVGSITGTLAPFGTADFSVELDFSTVNQSAFAKTVFFTSGGTNNFVISVDRNIDAYDVGSLTLVFGGTLNKYVIDYGSDIFDQDAKWLLTADRSGNAELYRDGSLVGSVNISADVSTDLDGTTLQTFVTASSGYVARSVTIFNTALTASQALALHNLGPQGFLAEYPELAWGGDEGGVYTSDWSSTVDGWDQRGTGLVSSVGGYLQMTASGAGIAGTSEPTQTGTALGLVVGDRVRVSFLTRYISGSTGSGALNFTIQSRTGSLWDLGETGTFSPTSSWVRVSYDYAYTSISANSEPYLRCAVFAADDVVEFDDFTFTKLGALAHLPLNDDCRNLQDIGPNRYDAVASATGITHLKRKDTHKFRDDNADGTGGSYLVANADILTASETITGVSIDGRFYAASGAQTLTYRRIRLLTSGSDILVQRSNGTTHETIATVTPASVTDFAITAIAVPV